jgi:hypothetical protein
MFPRIVIVTFCMRVYFAVCYATSQWLDMLFCLIIFEMWLLSCVGEYNYRSWKSAAVLILKWNIFPCWKPCVAPQYCDLLQELVNCRLDMSYLVSRTCFLLACSLPNRCDQTRSVFSVQTKTTENTVSHEYVVPKGFITLIDLDSCFHRQPKPIKFIWMKTLLKEPSQDVSPTRSKIISPEIPTHSSCGIPKPLKYNENCLCRAPRWISVSVLGRLSEVGNRYEIYSTFLFHDLCFYINVHLISRYWFEDLALIYSDCRVCRDAAGRPVSEWSLNCKANLHRHCYYYRLKRMSGFTSSTLRGALTRENRLVWQ